MYVSADESLDRLRKEGDYRTYVEVAGAFNNASAEAHRPPLRLAWLRNVTIEPLIPVISGEVALAGFTPKSYVGHFDNILQDALDPNSDLYQFNPDAIVLIQWLEILAPKFVNRFLTFDREGAKSEVARITASVGDVVGALRRHTDKPILLNNFPLPPYTALGILDGQEVHYQTQLVIELNRSLMNEVKQWRDVFIVDYMQFFGRIGTAHALDPRLWHVARMPFSREALVPLGQLYGRFIRALNGVTRKCLILDCDNTLWGGVIGEDLASGIQLSDDYPGSCFKSLQQHALALKDRGIILALCSKNNEQDVLQVLQNHPDMLIKEKDLATWRINWDNKAANIRSIVEELNIGFDSVVYVDDSSFECDLVQTYLPDVNVIHLTGEPTHYVNLLNEKGGFDSLSYSNEDRRRTEMYKAETHRQELQRSADNIEDYLAQLEMQAEIGLNDPFAVSRVAQLTQKTNQFNLTTRRYTQGDIESFVKDPQVDVLHLKLTDRISDLGIIGASIIRYVENEAHIDTLLLSCRAIGRRIEDVILHKLQSLSSERGCEVICAQFIPTGRNQQVEALYPSFGFSQVGNDADGSVWVLKLSAAEFKPPKWVALIDSPSLDKSGQKFRAPSTKRALG